MDLNLDVNGAYFIENSTVLANDKSLESQCNNGDLIYICKAFKYITKLGDIRRELYYYTNLSFNKLICYFLTEYSVPISDWEKYRLKRRGQFIPTEAWVPFEGISDEIKIVNISGK